MSAVTAEHRRTYATDGAVVLRGALNAAWLALLDRGIEHNIRRPGKNFVDFTATGESARCVKDYWSWRDNPHYQAFLYESPLAELAGELLEAEEICFLEDQFFEKAAGARTPSPWHQDAPYYEIAGRFCTAWMPLDPVGKDSCLEIVAGSNRWGKLFTPASFSAPGSAPYFVDDQASPLPSVPDIETRRDEYRILSWSLEPGDVLFFSPFSLHGNPANPSPHRARRAAMRWVAEDAVYDPAVFPWASLLDGHGLAPGERLIGENFPLLWTRELGLLGRQRSAEAMEYLTK